MLKLRLMYKTSKIPHKLAIRLYGNLEKLFVKAPSSTIMAGLDKFQASGGHGGYKVSAQSLLHNLYRLRHAVLGAGQVVFFYI